MSTPSSEPALRVLRHDDVLAAAEDVDPVASVEATLLLHARGATTLPDEAYLPWHTASGAFARSLALPGAVWGDRPAVGLKVINSSLDNPSRGLPRAQGWTFLFDPDTARPIAMLSAAWISATRTAAYTVLSARRLAAPGLDRIAVLGCGAIAESHLDLLRVDYPDASVVVFDQDPARARSLAALRRAEVADDPRTAVEGAGLVVCTTTTTTGYIALDWLAPGALVAHVSLDDVLPEVATGADLVVVDDWNLIAADDRRLFGRMLREGTLCGPGESTPGARAVDATLADVVAGRHPGRAKDTDVVLSNPFGMGVLDVALAADVHDAALARDLGTVLEP